MSRNNGDGYESRHKITCRPEHVSAQAIAQYLSSQKLALYQCSNDGTVGVNIPESKHDKVIGGLEQSFNKSIEISHDPIKS